jgi:acetyl-CoA synthetase
VDDVINVSGHRLSTAEIEAALAQDKCIAEVACIGGRDDLTGESIHAFCVIKPNILHTDNLTLALISQVRKTIGPFAKPKAIYLVTDLPKTRSGKVLRRILRKIVNNESHEIGDTSTMANPSVIQQLIEKVKH